MNDLELYYHNTKERAFTKYLHYLDVYDKHCSIFRGKSPCVVEIGIGHGGSLQMWKHYFGKGAKIYGIDIQERFAFKEDQIEPIIGDQKDINFLNYLKTNLPKIDVLIDDGSHFSQDQIVTFENLFPHMNDHGIYACEDLHYAYRPEFYKNSNMKFTDYLRDLADYITGERKDWIEHERLRTVVPLVKGVYFYVSIDLVEKGPYNFTPSSPVKVGIIPEDQRESSGPHI